MKDGFIFLTFALGFISIVVCMVDIVREKLSPTLIVLTLAFLVCGFIGVSL